MTVKSENSIKFRDYLNDCFAEVSDAVDSNDPNVFEKLKDVRFVDHVPNYSDPVTVSYYQLRYACGYAFEYYIMYRMLIEWIQLSGCEKLNVVSLGCGVGLDFYSACKAFESLADVKVSENGWRGVDLAQPWGEPKPTVFNSGLGRPFPDLKHISFLRDGAAGFFKSFAIPDSCVPCNVFFFPRVLSELDYSVMEELSNSIRNARFSSEPFWVCISNRAANEFVENDNVSALLEAFASKGFTKESYWDWRNPQGVLKIDWLDSPAEIRPNTDNPQWLTLTDSNGGTCKISDLVADGSFSLSSERPNVINFINKSKKDDKSIPARNCSEVCNCDACDAKKTEGTCPLKSPLSTTSQMNFQLYKFTPIA